MKKLMFAGIAALCATVVLADGEISSANVVGYTTKAVEAGKYYLIGTQFDEAATATAGRIDMNKLISLSASLDAGTFEDDFATAPQILVLNPSGVGYKSYYYISDGTDENDDELGYDTWCDDYGYELDDSVKLTLGKGFWFYSPTTSGTITTAGQVSDAPTKTIEIPANQYSIICNPYPVAVALQSLTTSATPGLFEDDFATAPQILVQKPSTVGYDTYYYISDGTDENDDEVGKNAWCDDYGYELSGTQINAGAAVWIKAPVAGSVTFSLQ